MGRSSNDVVLGNEQDNIIDGLKGDDTLTGEQVKTNLFYLLNLVTI